MKIYNGKVYANPGMFVESSSGEKGWIVKGYSESNEYVEKSYYKGEVKIYGGGYVRINMYYFKMDEQTKKRLVSLLFSNDDQIAIMLNHEQGTDTEGMYEFMQDWRAWISQLIAEIKEGVGTE